MRHAGLGLVRQSGTYELIEETTHGCVSLASRGMAAGEAPSYSDFPAESFPEERRQAKGAPSPGLPARLRGHAASIEPVSAAVEEDLLGWLALLRFPRRRGLDRVRLIELWGEPSGWLRPGAAPVPDRALARAIGALDWDAAEHDLRWLGENDVRLIRWTDPDYPELLRHIGDPPVALLCRGELGRAEPAVAVVGSRRASPGGRSAARQLGADLAAAGLCVVSGLALGIDTEAHRGALDVGGRTVAVLGSGLARPYPRANQALAEVLGERGALISEYLPHTPPAARHFPHRNRIISGLCLGVVVVEAAERSGSLITARLAGEQGREVLAMPGAVANPLSRGCHRLLRQGAGLVESALDVIEEILPGWPSAGPTERPEPGPSAEPADTGGSPAHRRLVLDAVDFVPTPVESIIGRSGLTPEVVSSILLALELGAEVRAEVGGTYTRVHQYGRAPRGRP